MKQEKLLKIDGEFVVMTFDQVFDKYKNMVYQICNKWKNVIELSDLYQVASIGLYKAFTSYDMKKDIEFSTVAYTYIKNEIRSFYREAKKHFGYLSLNEEMFEEGNEKLIDSIKDEGFEEHILEEISKKQDLSRVYTAMRHLTERQKSIFTKYYLEGKTMQEIADKYGFHVSYIGKVLKNSIKKIKDNIE
ncbi:sigma-70 family RNA polymerase sigma factor [Thermobrachium celere]|uniref:RNA polymerase sporulation specific sigma factor SigK n=1 Tax=Thermobrachium celere DSM 8682 TaxID=941824 RepID=R7RRH9_9CLOT|nr:sigma-70 family RNA polymerase sigma factor [Thermobrachium celere]CDF58649.1 RNA polymerase sporulation specific sigma factor SigK [Thermobrachium celere DSM 8682]